MNSIVKTTPTSCQHFGEMFPLRKEPLLQYEYCIKFYYTQKILVNQFFIHKLSRQTNRTTQAWYKSYLHVPLPWLVCIFIKFSGHKNLCISLSMPAISKRGPNFATQKIDVEISISRLSYRQVFSPVKLSWDSVEAVRNSYLSIKGMVDIKRSLDDMFNKRNSFVNFACHIENKNELNLLVCYWDSSIFLWCWLPSQM